jgi:ubiquinone/menaquinone biosynthesis C-methylase UbiE
MTTTSSEAAASDIRNPLFARFYHRILGKEGERMRRVRERLLAGLEGTVIEVGAGDGRNFELYPPEVKEVIAVEPEPYLRERARERAASAAPHVEVVAGTAEALPAASASIDGVVCCLVLCSVPDQPAAVEEARRVLRPSGELRLFEHVGAHGGPMRLVQRAAEATFWPRAFGNCHLTRDTLETVRRQGFDVSRVERFHFTPGGIEPPVPHILGAAR